jgi:bacterial/archaeal transporter family protein
MRRRRCGSHRATRRAANTAPNNARRSPYRQCATRIMIPGMTTSNSWFVWALLSAVFAAITAIFAKLGIQGVDSDYATLIRTAVVIVVLGAFVALAGKWSDPRELPAKTWLFLTLSGLATGASWVCYFRALKVGEASKVAPVDKLSLVLVAVFAFAFLGERPSLREWSGIAMVGGGVLLLAWKRGGG